MTEYRIVCDHVRTDNAGRSWVLEARHPLGATGNTVNSIFRDKEEAEHQMEKYKEYGKAYELRSEMMAATYPKLYSTIIRQINYRIQSREVTDWE